MSTFKISAIITAGGASSRFGSNKLLEKIKDKIDDKIEEKKEKAQAEKTRPSKQ